MREGGGKEIDGSRPVARRRRESRGEREKKENFRVAFLFFFSFFSDERDWRVDRRGAANFGTPFDNIYRRQCESSVIGPRRYRVDEASEKNSASIRSIQPRSELP